MNEEKVTVAGCSTGSKEILRRKFDKNVANKKHRNTPRTQYANGLKMYTFKRGDDGVGLACVLWCECSAAVEEGRMANERAWVVVVE